MDLAFKIFNLAKEVIPKDVNFLLLQPMEFDSGSCAVVDVINSRNDSWARTPISISDRDEAIRQKLRTIAV